MKKRAIRKLRLTRETLVHLDLLRKGHIAGAASRHSCVDTCDATCITCATSCQETCPQQCGTSICDPGLCSLFC